DEPESFGPKLSAHRADTRDVATWPVEAGDKPRFNRVPPTTEDDRDGVSCGFSHHSCGRAARCGDDSYAHANQIGCQFRQAIILIVRPSVFDGHVAALNITRFAQSFAECCQEMCVRFGRTWAEEPDHRHHRLLPPRALHLHREQQTTAADQGNELTPRRVEHGPLPGTRCASLPQAQDAPEGPAGPWGGPESF